MLGIQYGCTTLLLILARETGKDGLPELTLHILQKPGCTILSILNVIFLMTSMVAYLILGGDMITSWFELGGVEHLIFGNDNATTLPGWKRAVIIFLNNIILLLLAMFLPTAKPILSIGGALRGCVVDFIFPSGMFLVYHWNDYSKYSFNFIVLYLCTIFGAVTDIIATYQAVIDAMNSLK